MNVATNVSTASTGPTMIGFFALTPICSVEQLLQSGQVTWPLGSHSSQVNSILLKR